MRLIRQAGMAISVCTSVLAMSACTTDAPPATAQLAPERCEVTGSRIVSRRNCGTDPNVHSVSGDSVRSLMDRPVRPPAAPGGGG